MPLLPRTLAAIVLNCAVALVLPALAKADTIYTYTGEKSGSKSVTGTLTLASPLASNLSDASITPLSFSFNDGFGTLTNANSISQSFELWTSATGSITGFYIYVQAGANSIILTDDPRSGGAHNDLVFAGMDGYTTNGPGTLAPLVIVPPSTAVTPEPSSLLLLGTGILWVAGSARRRFVDTPTMPDQAL